MTYRYPLSSPASVSPEAIEAAVASLRSGQLTMGATVRAFEDAFADYVGVRYAVMVNSGSSANLLAVEAMLRPSHGTPRWTAGDHVLVPALAWPTTVWPLVQLGLVPVFVDSNPITLAMSSAIPQDRRATGTMMIHVLGCDAQPQRWAGTLIEDCCEHLHTADLMYGILRTYSFFFAHHLSTIEGGMIVTNDEAVANDLRSMRAHGWTRNRTDAVTWDSPIDARFRFVTTGYNVRPLEVQAAIGLAQLPSMGAGIAQRRCTGAVLTEAIRAVPWLRVPGRGGEAWMNLPILLADDAPMARDAVVQQFEQAGIETRPILAGNLLRHPVIQRLRDHGVPMVINPDGYPVADRVMDRGFMIGCHGPAAAAVEAVGRACEALRVSV